MRLVVSKPDPDEEVLLQVYESEWYDLEYNTLGKGFWNPSEWSEIVARKFWLKKRIESIKEKLRDSEV